MNYYAIFWILFIILTGIIIYCDVKHNMLRDTSIALIKPYSFARVQLAWWTIIVLASFMTVMIYHKEIPTFTESTLYLLGIASATTVTAAVIDINDQNNLSVSMVSQNDPKKSFLYDILSDKNGINIHRFQTFVFNLVFGVWFIVQVLNNLGKSIIPNCNTKDCLTSIDYILPVITPNNLILLGLSSGVYAGLKMTENKQASNSPVVASPPNSSPFFSNPDVEHHDASTISNNPPSIAPANILNSKKP